MPDLTAKNITITPAPDTPPVWGRTPAERTARQLQKIGGTPAQALWLRGDVLYDDAVLRGLLAAPEKVALALPTGEPLAGTGDAAAWLAGQAPAPVNLVTPAQIGANYNLALRKKADAACHIVTPASVRTVEWLLYKSSYKGVTDLVTKYVWPVPAYHATRWCARRGISPNMVTLASAVLMVLALLLFWFGDYGFGLLAGWGMTFLDTVDGKLARCTLTSSKWGNIFDHGIDLLHPPFWYLAWGAGLAHWSLGGGWVTPGITLLFIAYITGRLCEGYFMRRYGFHIHVWRRPDSLFRLVVARRNPNLIILSLSWLCGRPDIGLALVILWTIAAVPVHVLQIVQAERIRRGGGAITSWLSA